MHKEYDFKVQTLIPSIFGANKLNWFKAVGTGLFVEAKRDYYGKLAG